MEEPTTGLGLLYQSDPKVRDLVDDRSLTSTQVSEKVKSLGMTTSERAVRRLRNKISNANRDTPVHTTPAGAPEPGSGRMTLTGDEGEFKDVGLEEPIVNSDWDHVFRKFNLDPDVFYIVDDTVRMSTWQQSKRLENGERDVVNLYSYSARFRRKKSNAVTDSDIREASERLRRATLPRRIPGSGLGPSVAIELDMSDLQIGKSEGGGVKATIERFEQGLERFQKKVDNHRRLGVNLDEVVLVNVGDPYEGTVAKNYESQLFTVEANLRTQMNLVLDMWTFASREFFPQFDRGQFVSVLCNHTEFGRAATKESQTSDSDSGGAFLAETLERILHTSPDFQHVNFTIPHDEMAVFTEIAGVPCGFTHGHKIKGEDRKGFETWLNGQARGSYPFWEARVWTVAHRHNFQVWEMGSTTVFQCPSCDGGSKWLRDSTGTFSNSGMISKLIGNHHRLGWSDVAFL